MKLTKIQTIVLVVIAIAIIGGFAWVSFQDIGAPKKIPDPGAEARKKYQDETTKEKKPSSTAASLQDFLASIRVKLAAFHALMWHLFSPF